MRHCRLPLAAAVFSELGARLTTLVREGELTDTNQRLFEITVRRARFSLGNVPRSIFSNASRYCHADTAIRRYDCRTKAEILDTRKTTPTLRTIEKYAVAVGGGRITDGAVRCRHGER